MDFTLVLVATAMFGIVFAVGSSHHLTGVAKILTFWFCYVGVCLLVSYMTGQELNAVLLAPLSIFASPQNQTVITQAANVSIGNATTTISIDSKEYIVANLTMQNNTATTLNGTILAPDGPIGLFMTALLAPLSFAPPWGIILQTMIIVIFIQFIWHFVRSSRDRNNYYNGDYYPPNSGIPRITERREETQAPPPPPPPAPAPQVETQATQQNTEEKDGKGKKRDRWETVKV